MSREPDRITRRTVLRGAAVAGAATLVRPGAGVASAGARVHAGVFSRYVGGLAAATKTAPIEAPRPFTLVGVQWRSPAGPQIELRTRGPSTGGRWSPWVSASVRGHEPDQALPSGDGQFGEPIWTGPASEVQLRSGGAVAGVRLHFVAEPAEPAGPAGPAGDAHTAQALPLAQPILDAGPGQPPIIARAAWARGHAPPSNGPFYGTVKLAFVHHSEYAQRLRPRPGPLDPAHDLRLPPLRARLLRHRLQLRGRRLRPDLGGARRRDRRGRDRRARRRLQRASRPASSCSAASRRRRRRPTRSTP